MRYFLEKVVNIAASSGPQTPLVSGEWSSYPRPRLCYSFVYLQLL